MYRLLSFLFIAGLTNGTAPNTRIKAGHSEIRCEQARGSIVVLAEGSEGWQGREADRLVAGFDSALGFCQLVQVLRFDAEPPTNAEYSVEGADGDLLVLRPRTPLRDAAVTGFQWLNRMPGPRSMILIAHEQFYASALSTDELIGLAHRSKTTIHTVHIALRRQGGGFFRRLQQAFKDGSIWLFDSIGEDEHSYSATYTARMLKRLANATEGTACVTAVGPVETSCQNLITDRIVVRAQPNSTAPVRQSNCDSSMQEP